jgi:hypothetical protein
MGEAEMRQLAGWMVEALRRPEDEPGLRRLAGAVRELCLAYPVPGLAPH